MSSSTKLSTADQKTLADRFLLTPGLSEFPRGVILVSCGDAMGGSPAEVRLTLTAPGLDEHSITLNSLREGLAAWLRLTLTREGLEILEGLNLPEDMLRALSALVNTNWAYNVTIEPRFQTEEPEIVVSIDDCQVLGYRSHQLILAAANLYLAPIARRAYQQVITLAGGQRYVPLDFEVDDLFRRSMQLVLHPTLEFVRPRIVTVRKYDGDRAWRNAYFMEQALEMALDRFEFVQMVSVRVAPDGVHINVTFGGRHSPTAADLNAVQAAIAGVVRNHVYLKSGFFTSLVLAPAHSHSDPEGECDEDLGWLGENREY